jgi:hypothetical protein
MNTLTDGSANLVIHSRFNDMSRVRLFDSFFFFSRLQLEHLDGNYPKTILF